MQQKQIDLTDWQRLLAGSTPWHFLLEVVLRASFTYLLLMFAMRLLGKRMSAQLSLFELSMVVTLAAATGIPLQVPDRGLLPPIVVLAVVILFQQIVSRLGLRHRIVERVTAGDETLLIQDGRLLLDNLRAAVLSREKVFGILRVQGVQHLGEVERLFIESSGDFSLVRAPDPPPGLSLIPAIDPELRGKAGGADVHVCAVCGHQERGERVPAARCCHCHCTEWVYAVTALEE